MNEFKYNTEGAYNGKRTISEGYIDEMIKIMQRTDEQFRNMYYGLL